MSAAMRVWRHKYLAVDVEKLGEGHGCSQCLRLIQFIYNDHGPFSGSRHTPMPCSRITSGGMPEMELEP